ncbi:hypothetical protein CBM2589_A90362 [Cupriavidus taiwanensis]|uniref:Uncharacterized protein n=1 Tax=Cupriavidus taiwanensis TaxID=164546 RepID=A0A375CFK7_9BURK|nr:hypothetical protein CBM2589_A90362 [Cupriavidus taiwanensis]
MTIGVGAREILRCNHSGSPGLIVYYYGLLVVLMQFLGHQSTNSICHTTRWGRNYYFDGPIGIDG